MAGAPSIKVIKQFTYRGTARQWSNRYHFDNSKPVDSTHWTTFSDAITTAEKALFYSAVSIVGTVGYDAGSDVPIFNKTYALAGTYATGTFETLPGDCAALVRYSTNSRTSKNHPLYLFNYYHSVYKSTGSTPDTIIGAQVTAYQTYAAAWIAGFSDGGVTHHRCGPNGDLATGSFISPNVHHRDFPSG